MSISLSTPLLALLIVAAGVLNGLSPDRWLPTSVLAWQKGWRLPKTLGFLVAAFSSHVLAGYLIYLVLQRAFSAGGATRFLFFTLALMIMVVIRRGFRISDFKNVFRIGQKGGRGRFAALSFLGPCEVLVPIFAKAKILGIGYIIPLSAYLLGTWVIGVALVFLGQICWNQAARLPSGILWVFRPQSVIPMVIGAVFNIGLIFLI